MTTRRMWAAALLASGLSLAAIGTAHAQGKGLDEPFREGYKKALAGKTVGFIPVAMGFDLAEGWAAGLKAQLEPSGIKVVVRDPNWNTNAGAQAFTTLIAEKPAVIIIHNPDVQTYAKLIKKAEDEGIYVVQINMRSAQPSTAFVGADWVDIGERDTQAVVDSCKGKSNKIAIVQGAPTAAASAYTLKGVENVLAKNPQVKVVSNQAADWDAAKESADADRAQAASRPVRHRRLLGRHGHRHRGRDQGGRAHRQGVPRTSGGGEQKGACDQVKSGAFDLDISYDVPTQASNMAAMIKWLVQDGVKPGAAKQNIYTTLIPITKANASNEGACWKLAAK